MLERISKNGEGKITDLSKIIDELETSNWLHGKSNETQNYDLHSFEQIRCKFRKLNMLLCLK